MRKYADILVVDDDPLVQMNYLDILSDSGFNVIGADSLAQARREIMGRRFDLIVCDHDLGDGKGLALVAQLATMSEPPPVIYLSATLPSILQEVSKMSPVVNVLSKPVEPGYLLDIVCRLAEGAPDEVEHYPNVVSQEERDLLLKIFS